MKKLTIIISSLIILLISITLFFIYKPDNSVSSVIIHSKDQATKLEYNVKDIKLNYEDVENYINEINKYLMIPLSNKNILDKLINESESIKMYDKDDNRILEVYLKEEKVHLLLSSIIKVDSDINLKVIFSKNTIYDDIDLDKLYNDINREQIIRDNIVRIAKEQVGKTGETYWNWYGYNHRVEWCAVFVSWVAYKSGILNDKVPKFVWVKKGVDYYKEKNELKLRKDYTPKKGDIIFFNWNNDGIIDHVGIVEKVTKKYVYTIEGNVNRKTVKNLKYDINSPYIYAYGVPEY